MGEGRRGANFEFDSGQRLRGPTGSGRMRNTTQKGTTAKQWSERYIHDNCFCGVSVESSVDVGSMVDDGAPETTSLWYHSSPTDTRIKHTTPEDGTNIRIV